MYILTLCTICTTVILFYICYKKIDGNQKFYDENVSEFMERCGDNKKLCEEILNYTGNTTTKVEVNPNSKIQISFYNCNNDKILIKETEDLKDCSRLIHIAHECVHSNQSKRLLRLHFIFSNIQILYFLGIFIYFFYNRGIDIRLPLLLIQVFVFICTFFIKIVLESDASYRAYDLATGYLEKNSLSGEKLSNFKKLIEKYLYGCIAVFYFTLFSQGAVMLIIAQVGAIMTCKGGLI